MGTGKTPGRTCPPKCGQRSSKAHTLALKLTGWCERPSANCASGVREVVSRNECDCLGVVRRG